MLKLHETAYSSYGRALLLVIDAMEGKIASPDDWQSEIDQLERYQHGLMADGLRWQYYAYVADGDQKTDALKEKLITEGCVNPDRLMNIVIPIPYRK